MIARPDAEALLAGPLGQWLARQDQARAEARVKSRRYTTYGVIAALVLGGVVLVISQDIEWAFWSAAVPFGLGTAAAFAARKAVTDRIKSAINAAIAEALGLQYSAAVTPGEPFARAKAFSLLPAYDDDSFEDLWWGALGERPFTLHEAKLTEERGSGKSRRTVTVFHGSVLCIGFARDFIGTTLIERDTRHRGFFGGQKEEIEVNGITMARVDMVDPRFEDAFAIWSSDGVEARYLVHPEYVERLIAVEEAYAGQNIRALFHGGELLIVLELGDMFESGSLDAQSDRALLERTIQQFTTLADLAARLNERPRG